MAHYWSRLPGTRGPRQKVQERGIVEYGPSQARLDQEIVLAIRQSSLEGGHPVPLTLDRAVQD
jgi:hypothetical protein